MDEIAWNVCTNVLSLSVSKMNPTSLPSTTWSVWHIYNSSFRTALKLRSYQCPVPYGGDDGCDIITWYEWYIYNSSFKRALKLGSCICPVPYDGDDGWCHIFYIQVHFRNVFRPAVDQKLQMSCSIWRRWWMRRWSRSTAEPWQVTKRTWWAREVPYFISIIIILITINNIIIVTLLLSSSSSSLPQFILK